MSDDQIKRYEHIWTTEKNQWVLLADEDSQRDNDFIPYHIKSWRFLAIDDSNLQDAIVKKMMDAGMPQVTDEDIFGRK